MGKRNNIVFGLGVLSVFGVVVLAYALVLGPNVPREPIKPTSNAEMAVPADVAPSMRLQDAAGVVEMRSPSGAWQVMQVGAELQAGANLRTVQGATASLHYGDALTVQVLADSALRLESLDGETARFTVEEGLLIADVEGESGKSVEVRTVGSDAVATTQNGRLHISADGKGGLQAAVSRGSAEVRNMGETVTLKEGFQTTVAADQAPTQPLVMPSSLLLKVRWPTNSTTAKRRHRLVGITSPGARVRVGEHVVTADDRGEFTVILELSEGTNILRASTMDLLGRSSKASSEPIILDTKAPAHVVDTHPDMWKQVGK